MPYKTLLRRLFQAGAKWRVEQLLRAVKAEHRLGKRLFSVTGTQDEIAEAVRVAIEEKVLTIKRLSALVDEAEENGRQHIFLFEVPAAGLDALTEQELGAYPLPPAEPTEAFYADEPTARRTYFVRRGERLCLKQVYLAEYWQLGDEQETDDQKTKTWDKIKVRAVNILVVDRASRTAEIRIDRVRTDRVDNSLALKSLAAFVESIDNPLDIEEVLRPTPIWQGFRRIVEEAQNETYMNVDSPADATAEHTLANRRARRSGPDIRKHPQHPKGAHLVRDTLAVYWRIPDALIPDGAETWVHTYLTRIRKSPVGALGKAYVGASVSPDQLDHVLARVRFFAS